MLKLQKELFFRAILMSLLLLSLSGAARAQVVTYPAPAGISPSNIYTVQLVQGKTVTPSFVYMVQNPATVNQPTESTELTTSWTSFDTSGPVTVQVQMSLPSSQALVNPQVRILPSGLGIAATVPTMTTVGPNIVYTTTFTINNPGQFAVDFFDAATNPNDAAVPLNPMLIFANGPDNPPTGNVITLNPGALIPRSIPSGSTLYFGPGVYDLGTIPYLLGSNQSVYLEGGAYVKGAFAVGSYVNGVFTGGSAQNTRIEGHGILSGENYQRNGVASPPLSESVQDGLPPMIYIPGSQSQNDLVDGVTLIQAPFYNIMISGQNNIVNNVKAISWYASTDGVQVAYDAQKNGVKTPGAGVISNSFFKVGDDAIKLFSSNLSVFACVVWQLQNAAAFELGANVNYDLSNVDVSDSDVIRTEYNWPQKTNAVFAANYGGPGNLNGYTFNNIRIENANWQLFDFSITPNAWLHGNTALGSISNLKFNNIRVTDTQTMPDIFQSYDHQHQISGVFFNNVTVGNQTYPSSPYSTESLLLPKYTYNANRTMSLKGNIIADPLWHFTTLNNENQDLQVWLMDPLALNPTAPCGISQNTPCYNPIEISEPGLTDNTTDVAKGDFYGDGAAGLLTLDPIHNLEIWRDPLNTLGLSWVYPLNAVPDGGWAGWEVAGTGDFNGDGISDILLWNTYKQEGEIFLMNGAYSFKQSIFHPGTTSDWVVAGVGDFDQNGYSDVLLRDSKSNLEILYFDATGTPISADIKPPYYASTTYYKKNYNGRQNKTGHFDPSWSIAGVGDTEGDGYAKIIWANYTTGDLAMTNFIGNRTHAVSYLFAKLPSPTTQIQALGDYNGDGAVDLLLRNSFTNQTTVWYLNWFGGNLFEPGPDIQPALNSNWRIQGESMTQIPEMIVSLMATNASYTAPANITLMASVSNSNGTISKVNFYNDDANPGLLGTATNWPYMITWNNVPAGTYRLSALATDTAGEAVPSQTITITVKPQAAPPAAPTALTATPGNGQVELSWKASPGATSYYIIKEYSSIAVTTTNSFIDYAVINGTTFHYAVSAVNTSGEGAASAPVSATPEPTLALSSAPTSVTATSGNGKVTLTWTASPSATHYWAARGTSSGVYTIRRDCGTGTNCVDNLVTNGVTYYYSIVSYNAQGTSFYSKEVSVIATQAGLPTPPTTVSASRGIAAATVTFSGALANGSAITKYSVTSSPGGITATGTSSPITITGLTNGTSYTFSMTATNGVGTIIPSVSSKSLIAGTPKRPTTVTAAAGDGHAVVTFSGAVANAGPILYYTVISSPSGITAQGPASPITVTGLNNGTAYTFTVTPTNSFGAGGVSVASNSVTPQPALLAAPTSLIATPGNVKVILTWAPVTGAASYYVAKATDPNGPFVKFALAVSTTYTDTLVTNDTTYYYVVTAFNNSGESPKSTQVSATPKSSTAPMALSSLTAAPGNAQVTLSWNGSIGAASYNVKRATVSNGTYSTIANSLRGITYIDHSVVNGVSYYYVVSAVNSLGESPNSNQARATPVASLSAAVGLTATAGNAQVVLSWTASTGAAAYYVKKATSPQGPYTTFARAANNHYTDTLVSNGTTYYYVVSAMNANEEGPDSTQVSATP